MIKFHSVYKRIGLQTNQPQDLSRRVKTKHADENPFHSCLCKFSSFNLFSWKWIWKPKWGGYNWRTIVWRSYYFCVILISAWFNMCRTVRKFHVLVVHQYSVVQQSGQIRLIRSQRKFSTMFVSFCLIRSGSRFFAYFSIEFILRKRSEKFTISQRTSYQGLQNVQNKS